jgi:hypothetical protein
MLRPRYCALRLQVGQGSPFVATRVVYFEDIPPSLLGRCFLDYRYQVHPIDECLSLRLVLLRAGCVTLYAADGVVLQVS